MRIFKDLKLVEQLGTGIIRILKSYDKDIESVPKSPRDIKTTESDLNETQKNIIELIKENNRITQVELSRKLSINKTTVVRNINFLKEHNIIKRVGSTKVGQWEIL